MDAVEYVNGCAVQDQVAPGWLFFKRLGDVGGGTEFFGQGVGYVGKRVSGAGGYDEFDFRKKLFGFVPLGDLAEGVDANREKRVRRVF